MAEEHLLLNWRCLPSVILFHIFSHLPPKDRIAASSACRLWREALFHPNLWPLPRITLRLDLLAINTSSGPRSLTLPRADNSRDALTLFLAQGARFLEHVTILFDPSSVDSLLRLVSTLQALHENAVDDDFSGTSLKSLTLKPTNTARVDYGNHNRLGLQTVNRNGFDNWNSLLSTLWNLLEGLLLRSKGLEHVSFGCMEELLKNAPRFLELASNGAHRQTLQSLHLSSAKEDPDFYPLLFLEPNILTPFVSLKTLSIDFDYICDELLANLSGKQSLQSLVINVHGIDEEHPWVSNSSWTRLAEKKNLEVTINLMHTEEAAELLKDAIFDTDIPLGVLRIYYAGMSRGDGHQLVDLVNTVAIRHHATLRAFTLVDYHLNGFPNIAFSRTGENPLVMLAWRCRKLAHLAISGFEISDADLIAITRLRGPGLETLVIPSCCILLAHSVVEDEGYYDEEKVYLDGVSDNIRAKVCLDIAKPLNRTWMPDAQDDRLAQVQCQSPSSTYMEEILTDHSW